MVQSLTLKFKVSPQHIADGRPASATSCPIALALNEQPTFRKAYVWPTVGMITIDAKNYVFTPSDEMRAFLLRFDLGIHVDPQEFELTLRKKRLKDLMIR